MHSSLIGKVEKANRYARELDRISIDRLSITFRGDNDTHRVALDAGQWHCTCHYFDSWGHASTSWPQRSGGDAARRGAGVDLQRGAVMGSWRSTDRRSHRSGGPAEPASARHGPGDPGAVRPPVNTNTYQTVGR